MDGVMAWASKAENPEAERIALGRADELDGRADSPSCRYCPSICRGRFRLKPCLNWERTPTTLVKGTDIDAEAVPTVPHGVRDRRLRRSRCLVDGK